jgi:hypothetical protein
MKNKLLLLTSLLVLVFSSCKNIEQGSSNKATATVSFAADSARAIFKEHSNSDYTYTISGTSGSGDNFATDKKYTYEELLSARFEIQKGTWNFTMDAYAEDEPAFSGTKCVTLTDEPVSVSIPLHAVTGSTASLSVKLNYPENKGVAKITAGLYDSVTDSDTGSALTLGAGFVTYTNDDVPSGINKILRFYIYDSQDVCIGSFIEGVFLASSDSVTVERTLSNVNTFAASVSVKDVNGDDFIDSGLLVKAVKEDKKYPMTAVSGTNMYTASLPVGTYDVYSGLTDSGADLSITFINGGNTSLQLDYQVCSLNNFASMISSLTEDSTIVLSGELTDSDLTAIADAIKNSTYNVNLDLSNTTGITSIPDNTFISCSNLSGITIPDSVTTIGDVAFSGCTSLSAVTIPDSVTSIGIAAFDSCTSLSSVTIPDSVTAIESYAFYVCTSLTTITVDSNNVNYSSIDGVLFNKDATAIITYPAGKQSATYTIPDSVTSIGDSAFSFCSSLSSVTIGDSVTSISDYAFQGCTSLSSVTIGDSVTSIGRSAFDRCTSLASVTIPDSVTSIASQAFYGCTSLSSVTIGEFVTYIGSGAFYDCTSLSSVTIPDSVTSIDWNAFYGCTSLSSVTIPNSVTTIGNSAFRDCSSLSSVTIGGSVTSIGDSAFYGCKLLSSITIPDSVTSIGHSAFQGCTSLSSVTIGGSVTSIGSYAFYNCSSLSSVTIPGSVTSISCYAFYSCSKLTAITFTDTSNWYRTNNQIRWEKKTGGILEDVTNASANSTNFRTTYVSYYWYKLDE